MSTTHQLVYLMIYFVIFWFSFASFFDWSHDVFGCRLLAIQGFKLSVFELSVFEFLVLGFQYLSFQPLSFQYFALT